MPSSLPFVALFIIFNIGPFFWALWLSLLRGDLVDQVKPFVGLQNYMSLTTDDITLKVFLNSLQIYSVCRAHCGHHRARTGLFDWQ